LAGSVALGRLVQLTSSQQWRQNRGMLLLFATFITSLQTVTIKATDAKAHIGETATVCGIVRTATWASTSDRKPTFLNVDEPYPKQLFTVVIFEDDRSKFTPPPERQFAHKNICVTGIIREYRGTPEIVVTDQKQIVVEEDQTSDANGLTANEFSWERFLAIAAPLISALGGVLLMVDAIRGPVRWMEQVYFPRRARRTAERVYANQVALIEENQANSDVERLRLIAEQAAIRDRWIESSEDLWAERDWKERLATRALAVAGFGCVLIGGVSEAVAASLR
jgi:hypothetical protein